MRALYIPRKNLACRVDDRGRASCVIDDMDLRVFASQGQGTTESRYIEGPDACWELQSVGLLGERRSIGLPRSARARMGEANRTSYKQTYLTT